MVDQRVVGALLTNLCLDHLTQRQLMIHDDYLAIIWQAVHYLVGLKKLFNFTF